MAESASSEAANRDRLERLFRQRGRRYGLSSIVDVLFIVLTLAITSLAFIGADALSDRLFSSRAEREAQAELSRAKAEMLQSVASLAGPASDIIRSLPDELRPMIERFIRDWAAKTMGVEPDFAPAPPDERLPGWSAPAASPQVEDAALPERGGGDLEVAAQQREAERAAPAADVVDRDSYEVVVAREGETLTAVAERAGRARDAIAVYNGLPDDYAPSAGDELVVPPAEFVPAPPDRTDASVRVEAPPTPPRSRWASVSAPMSLETAEADLDDAAALRSRLAAEMDRALELSLALYRERRDRAEEVEAFRYDGDVRAAQYRADADIAIAEVQSRSALDIAVEETAQMAERNEMVASAMTRIGSVVLAIWLTKIFLKKYRNSVRLATFYTAVADAIALSDRSDPRSILAFLPHLMPSLPPDRDDDHSELDRVLGVVRDVSQRT